MKKRVIILGIIAISWLLLVILFELTIGQAFCPAFCDAQTGLCGCDAAPNHPIQDIISHGFLPSFILIVIAIILNFIKKKE